MRKIEHLLVGEEKRTDIAKSADYNETTTCEAISPMMATDRPTQISRRREGGRPIGSEGEPACERRSINGELWAAHTVTTVTGANGATGAVFSFSFS